MHSLAIFSTTLHQKHLIHLQFMKNTVKARIYKYSGIGEPLY